MVGEDQTDDMGHFIGSGESVTSTGQFGTDESGRPETLNPSTSEVYPYQEIRSLESGRRTGKGIRRRQLQSLLKFLLDEERR